MAPRNNWWLVIERGYIARIVRSIEGVYRSGSTQ